MSEDSDTRKPRERFEGAAGLLHLDQTATELLGLVDDDPHGRAQRTLYRHGQATVAMFAFRAGASLAEHAADAVVTIQCFRGRVRVTADDDAFDLATHDLVRLEPGVPHAVIAESAAAVVVHISGSHT